MREVVVKSVLRPAGKCVLGTVAITVTVTLLLRLVISAGWLLNGGIAGCGHAPLGGIDGATCDRRLAREWTDTWGALGGLVLSGGAADLAGGGLLSGSG